jgi:predicted AAA+ superfamily ATPase
MRIRYLEEQMRRDLQEKMVFLSGPREVGKTTLAKTFRSGEGDRYYTWDHREDRKESLSGWQHRKGLIIV